MADKSNLDFRQLEASTWYVAMKCLKINYFVEILHFSLFYIPGLLLTL